MDNGKSRGRKKIVFQMLVMVCILAIAGYFMQAKMMEFLNRTLEESFARQAADMAIAAEERFDRELEKRIAGSRKRDVVDVTYVTDHSGGKKNEQ